VSTATALGWGAAGGYLVGCIEYEIYNVRRVKREVAAQIAAARKAASAEKTTVIGHWSANRGYLYECGGHNDECPRPVGGTFVETRWPDGSRHITGWTEVPDDPA